MKTNNFHSRILYEAHLRPWIDKPIIKVITGMRRVGKSCLLKQLIEQLYAQQVPQQRIHLIDKESIEGDKVKRRIHVSRHSRIPVRGKNCLRG